MTELWIRRFSLILDKLCFVETERLEDPRVYQYSGVFLSIITASVMLQVKIPGQVITCAAHFGAE
jgi:hypothetical protein